MLEVVILLLSAFFPVSHQQCFTANDSVPSIKFEQYTEWVQSSRSFDVSLFKTLNDEGSQHNIIFSSSSIQDVLLLAYFGAYGETESALAGVLQLPASQTKPVNWRFYNVQRTLNDIISNQLKTANKIFLSDKLNLRRCMEEIFKNELELIDYQTDVLWAQDYINNWVAKQTGGHINDLFLSLSPASTATLVSAVYFKANWENKFNPKHTRLVPFNMNPKDVRITRMMVKADYFDTGYNKELKARFVVLPYEGNRTAMIILLPDKDLDTTINSMTEDSLSIITTKYFYKTLYFQVSIPKYEQKSYLDLTIALEKLGIGNTLTEYSDFSGFTGINEVSFNHVVHEAIIQVDEEGTTATAATGGVTLLSAPLPSEPFICDRPFAYIIYDYFASKILFMGTFREPTPE